jgi:hypothetical protein
MLFFNYLKRSKNRFITNKLGNVVDEIKIIEKGKTYPHNRSNPYYHDIYFVSLMDGTSINRTLTHNDTQIYLGFHF